MQGYLAGQPLYQGASNIATGMAGELPGLTSGLRSTLASGALTNPLEAAMSRDAGVVASGGAMTASEAAGLNAPLSAELGAAGMGHTAPGVFSQGMNTYQEMQNRLNTAIGQETRLAPTDVGIRTALPQSIQGLEGTAASAGLQTMLGGESAYTGLLGALSGPIASQILANQQAQAASATAGANKNAGLGSGALSALGSIGMGLALA